MVGAAADAGFSLEAVDSDGEWRTGWFTPVRSTAAP